MTAVDQDLIGFAGSRRFTTLLADPPWQFTNKTGKVAPEHKRLARYGTMTLPEIMALPVEQLAAPTAHLYLWCPNALLPDGIAVMKAWGFTYKSNIVWHKVRKDGGPDGRGRRVVRAASAAIVVQASCATLLSSSLCEM